MKNWTIGKRIITGGVTLLILLFIVGGVGITALRQIETLAEHRLRDDAIPGIVSSSEMATFSLRTYISTLRAGETLDAAKRQIYLDRIVKNVTEVDEAFKAYEAAISGAEDRKNFNELKPKRAAFASARNDYLAMIKGGKTEAATAQLEGTLSPAFDAYQEHMAMMLKWNEARACT